MKTRASHIKWVVGLCLFLAVPQVSFAIECVGYVRQQTGLGSYGLNAYDWAGKKLPNYKWHKNDGDKTRPQKRDIVVWKKGPGRLENGHVAIVNKVTRINSKQYTITLSEANWTKGVITQNRSINMKKKDDKYKIDADYVVGWHEKK